MTPDTPSPERGESSQDRVVIGRYRTTRQVHDAGLAVLACGQPYWALPVEDGYALAVEAEQAERLRREVELADRKNRFWPPARLTFGDHNASLYPTFTAIAILVAVFIAQGRLPRLTEIGTNAAASVMIDGAWWRLFTAITLHANLGHLMGNLLGLALFVHLSCRCLGTGLAWLLIVTAAAMANFTSDLLQVSLSASSLGASTAVFAALGLLTGFPLGHRLRSKEPVQARDWIVPLSAGSVLLAWLGGGNFPTDVLSHLESFAYAIVLSVGSAGLRLPDRLDARSQSLLLSASAAIIGLSWILAITHGAPAGAQ